MIQYERFAFAAAPRTGTGWFSFVAGCNKTPTATEAHGIPTNDWRGTGVTLVRHPYDWLVSIYGTCSSMYIGTWCGHDLAKLLRASTDVYEFIRSVTQRPGRVAEVFAQYAPLTIALRLEDFPWAAIELLEFFKLPTAHVLDQKIINMRRGTPHATDPDLRRAVIRAERDFCERYNYT